MILVSLALASTWVESELGLEQSLIAAQETDGYGPGSATSARGALRVGWGDHHGGFVDLSTAAGIVELNPTWNVVLSGGGRIRVGALWTVDPMLGIEVGRPQTPGPVFGLGTTWWGAQRGRRLGLSARVRVPPIALFQRRFWRYGCAPSAPAPCLVTADWRAIPGTLGLQLAATARWGKRNP